MSTFDIDNPEENPANEGLSPAELYPVAAHQDFRDIDQESSL